VNGSEGNNGLIEQMRDILQATPVNCEGQWCLLVLFLPSPAREARGGGVATAAAAAVTMTGSSVDAMSLLHISSWHLG